MTRAILYGGLVVGMLDLLDAFIFFGLRSGARPTGILHSIAAGAIGRDAARAGGMTTAALGVLLHFAIAVSITAIYVAASRFFPVLRRRWIICGLAYGVAAYFVMTFVIVPLSNAGPGRIAFALPILPILMNGLAIHALGVGLPAAYFAKRARIRELRGHGQHR
jgi:hypothetical protein